MKIGSIRVSKHEQNEALQRDAIREAGCEKYFSDTMTGSKFERKGLEQLLAFVWSGDTLIGCSLDRLGRSLKDLIGVSISKPAFCTLTVLETLPNRVLSSPSRFGMAY